MAVRAAIPPRPAARDAPNTAHAGARRELSLALADRLAEAKAEKDVCEAAVEEIQDAFGCPVARRCDRRGAQDARRAGAGEDPGRLVPAGRRGTGRPLPHRLRAGAQRRRAREPQYRSTEAIRGMRSELAVPILVDGSGGGRNLGPSACAAFTEDDAHLLESVASQVGGALPAIRLYESLDRAYIGTAEALSAALEEKDAYTAEHSRSIADNAVAVGRIMGMADDDLRMLRYAAAFHDIGKLAISREILNKPGPLTAAERIEIEQHTVIGERILEPIEFLAPIGRSSAAPTNAGTEAVTPTAWGRGDPARGPHPLRLRRLRRDDHRPSLPLGDALSEAREELGRSRHPVRPAVVEAVMQVVRAV